MSIAKLFFILFTYIDFLYNVKVRSIETHSTHGAMDCQRCIRCGDGFYSKGYSFKECEPCRNCDAEGRVLQKACSSSRNSVCGGKTLPS